MTLPEVSHTPEVSTIEMVGTDGKKRIVPKIRYRRSAKAEQAAEEYRLGAFAHQETTEDPSILAVMDNPHLMFVAPYVTARTIAATRIRRDKRTHKTMLGSDILAKYLDNDMPMREGYTQFHQLYIFFGYIDAPNSYLPSLLVQLVGQRFHEGLHCWVFMPKELAAMAAQWTEVMHSLSYLERMTTTKVSDQLVVPAGPVTTAIVKPPSPGSSFSKIPGSTDDPKLRGPRDKRIRR